MIEQTFTFGFDHRNPRTGESLGKRYVTLTGETKNACRAEMLSRFGREWSHQYDSPEAAGATKYGLTELTTGELPGESGKFTVDDNDENRSEQMIFERSDSRLSTIVYMGAGDMKQTWSKEWRDTPYGVVLMARDRIEIFIPWHRVLEITTVETYPREDTLSGTSTT